MSSHLKRGAVLSLLALGLASCSYSYPSAVILRSDVPLLAYKRCSRAAGIARVIIRRGVPGDKRTPIVWTARLRNGANPLFELPLRGDIPGYDVTLVKTLDADLYHWAEAQDPDGVQLGGPTFRLKDLRQNGALVSSDPEFGRGYEPLTWMRSRAECPEESIAATARFMLVVSGIFVFGLVFSVVVVVQDRRRRKALAQR